MTNWDHVASDTSRELLEGLEVATFKNMDAALNTMLKEQAADANDQMIPESVWWGRADALEKAHEAYMNKDKGLCMNRIKTFYSI